MKALIAQAIATPADPTDQAVALKIAAHFAGHRGCAAAATRLALTWGRLTAADAKVQGYRYTSSIAEDIADTPDEEMIRALEWAKKYVLLPTPGVEPSDFLIAEPTAEFDDMKKLAAERGRPFIIVGVSPQGYTAHIQTAECLCEAGSTCAMQHDPDGFMQNACRNLNRLIQANLPRLLAADGVTPEEWKEWQEDVAVANDALHGPGLSLYV